MSAYRLGDRRGDPSLGVGRSKGAGMVESIELLEKGIPVGYPL